jgi:hypothetical protein
MFSGGVRRRAPKPKIRPFRVCQSSSALTGARSSPCTNERQWCALSLRGIKGYLNKRCCSVCIYDSESPSEDLRSRCSQPVVVVTDQSHDRVEDLQDQTINEKTVGYRRKCRNTPSAKWRRTISCQSGPPHQRALGASPTPARVSVKPVPLGSKKARLLVPLAHPEFHVA